MISSNNQNSSLIREFLNTMKRHKTATRRCNRLNIDALTEESVKESFNVLNAQSERLEKNLKWLFWQNKKLLEDNRYMCANVVKTKKDNNSKLKDVFICAFSLLISADSGQEDSVEQNNSRTSQNSVNSDEGALCVSFRTQIVCSDKFKGFARLTDSRLESGMPKIGISEGFRSLVSKAMPQY